MSSSDAAAVEERLHRRVGRPLPGPGLDVAVGEHEPAGHRLERVDRGVGVVDGLQAVRPVDRGGDAGLERVPGRTAGCRRGCPRAGTACRARGSTRRSTGSASSRRRTPASRSATCAGGCRSCPASRCRRSRRSRARPRARTRPAPTSAIRSSTTSTSAPGEHGVRVVHRQHGPVAEQHGSTVGHRSSLLSRTSVRLTVIPSGPLTFDPAASAVSRVSSSSSPVQSAV